MTAAADLALPGLSPPVPSDVPDVRVIVLSRQDPDWFTLIFDRYYAQVHRYLARRVGTDLADDLSSEAFLIAFRQRGRFDDGAGAVRGWLYGIATNLVRQHRRDEIRAWRANARLYRDRASEYDDRVAAKVTAEGAGAAIAEALAGLSAKDRDVLLLVALGELSYPEVADALGIAYGTVCSRLSRARRVVRAALGHTDPTLTKDQP